MRMNIKSSNSQLPSPKLKGMLVEANLAFGHARETILVSIQSGHIRGIHTNRGRKVNPVKYNMA